MVAANSTPLRYPIDIRCPIGGGVFAKGKAGKFGVGGTPTNGQLDAADTYKRAGYLGINGTLRGDKNMSDYKDAAANLGSLIEHHGVTESAGVVYRGVSGSVMKEYVNKVGQKITLPGFLSTSKSKEFSNNWAKGTKGMLLRIYVPKGAKALDYDALMNKRVKSYKEDGMHEVILPHNSKFTVHAVSREKKGGKQIVDLIMHR